MKKQQKRLTSLIPKAGKQLIAYTGKQAVAKIGADIVKDVVASILYRIFAKRADWYVCPRCLERWGLIYDGFSKTYEKEKLILELTAVNHRADHLNGWTKKWK